MASFQEISMTFRAKLIIKLKWFDKRLTYSNLKKDNDERNSIGKIMFLFYFTKTPGILIHNIALKNIPKI